MKRAVLSAAAVLVATALPASAQDGDLASLLPRLLASSVSMRSTLLNAQGQPVTGNPHEAHFLAGLAQTAAPFALNASIVTQLATFPTGSSSGGFTYQSDATGIQERSSNNFGPAFTERALTIGRRKFSAGFNTQYVSFDQFESLDLDGGNIQFSMQHNNCCPPPQPDITRPTTDSITPFFEGDLVNLQLAQLKVNTQTVSLFGNMGITDRLDVGLVVPFVRVKLEASIFAEVDRIATGQNNPIFHSFKDVNGSLLGESGKVKTLGGEGTSEGLGDVLLRSKFRMVQAKGGGLAAALDVRLPTGDKDNLRGTGATQTKVSLIYSGEMGAFAPRASLGYTNSSGDLSTGAGSYVLGDQIENANDPSYAAFSAANLRLREQIDLKVPDEIGYTFGFSVAASPRLTLNFDALGRILRDQYRFATVGTSFNFRTSNTAPVGTVARNVFDVKRDSSGAPLKEDLNLLLMVAGFKFNVASSLLVTGNVLFQVSDGGLRARVAPVIGIDYAF